MQKLSKRIAPLRSSAAKDSRYKSKIAHIQFVYSFELIFGNVGQK